MTGKSEVSYMTVQQRRFTRRDVISKSATAMLCLDNLTANATPVGAEPHGRITPLGSIRQRITSALAALDEERLVSLAIGLANIPSPTGHEEDAARFLRDQMRDDGLTTHLQPVGTGRSNVLGIHGGLGSGNTLMFMGHLDAYVPRDDDKIPNVPRARLVGGKRICGNGILNMKGSLAAYIAAIRAVKDAGVDLAGDVVIAGVAGSFQNSPVDEFQGEEYRGFGVGTKHLLANGGVADMCVLGEPTGFEMVTQSFGVTCVRIDIQSDVGAQINAGKVAASVMELIEAWVKEYQRRNTIDGVVPQAGVIAVSGGRPWTTDGTPPLHSCSVFVEVRTPPETLPITVKREIRPVLVKARSRHPGVVIRAELYSTNPGTSVPEGSSVVSAVRSAHIDIFGVSPKVAVAGWHSDASHLNRYGVPTVNYGPGSGNSSSEAGEYLEVDELVNCARVYINLIVRVCADEQ